MILIADSGSTKTQWSVLEKGKVLRQILTKGINPFFQTEKEISLELQLHLLPELKEFKIDHIYFYGAGCSFPEKKLIVITAIGINFKDTIIEVESDLLGAARSLFQHNQGIACILGTGSNSCFYNGNKIVDNISPLGFILGDEGSGAVLGKILIADCLKNQISKKIIDKLMIKYNLSPSLIMDRVYKQPFPNRFLAELSPFLSENINEPAIFNIVYNSFDAFFVRNVMQYNFKDLKVGFVGSVAFYFSETLKIVASERNIALGEIVKDPMEGLIKFHNNLN